MLTPLDDSPWHQLPTTFDHVGPSDPRFFDRVWFAASDRTGSATLQFTLGVYQNMNVVDGGFVVVVDGHQHNLRASRELRPVYDTACGPLRFDVREPLRRIELTVAPNGSGTSAELVWTAAFAAQEERHHFARRHGRVLEDYSRYDQIGRLDGWVEVDGTRFEVTDWWACRDHSWGVRERVGIPEPHTGDVPAVDGAAFAFLFFSTDTHGGHLQVTGRGDLGHLTVAVVDLATGVSRGASRVDVDAVVVDGDRPRRFDQVTFSVTEDHDRRADAEPAVVTYEVRRSGPSVAMVGLGYGGYDDGRGLGVHRGRTHLEHEVWDVDHPALVTLPDGRVERPVHRIQPVTVTRTGPDGTSTGRGSLTFVAELPVDADGHLRLTALP